MPDLQYLPDSEVNLYSLISDVQNLNSPNDQCISMTSFLEILNCDHSKNFICVTFPRFNKFTKNWNVTVCASKGRKHEKNDVS